VSTQTPFFKELVGKALKSSTVSVYGFYCHAGNAYASTSISEATNFLSSEVEAVNTAAKLAQAILEEFQEPRPKFVLSVGSTPTAHAASAETRARLQSLLYGELELHAGNYPMLDLQQVHTSLVPLERVAQKVVATVISYYPERGQNGEDEAMCDAGAIAMSKDTGPSGSFGDIVGKAWKIGRMSQEHGILTQTSKDAEKLELGSVIEVVGQHACLIAAAYPYFYIVDSEVDGGRTVVDVWVPWKGW
jgi:D-serine deaminase-like pyridoxal phosphate-dependent protein